MSDASESSSGSASGGKKKLLPLILLLVGVIAGGGVGAFVAGPMLAAPAAQAAQANDVDDEHEEAPEEAPARKSRKSDTPPVLYAIDNLVLNPAESGGSRFLMVTAALELRDAKMADQMRARDPELRDVLLQVLGSKNVDVLADIAEREAIKEEVRKAIDAQFGRGAVQRVYLPQFVIQ